MRLGRTPATIIRRNQVRGYELCPGRRPGRYPRDATSSVRMNGGVVDENEGVTVGGRQRSVLPLVLGVETPVLLGLRLIMLAMTRARREALVSSMGLVGSFSVSRKKGMARTS